MKTIHNLANVQSGVLKSLLSIFLVSIFSVQNFATNIVKNGNFEQGSTQWTTSPVGSASVQSNDNADNSIVLNKNKFQNHFYLWQDCKVKAGEQYAIQLVASASANLANIGFEFYDAKGNLIGNKVSTPVKQEEAGEFTPYDFGNINVPSGASVLRLIAYTFGGALKLDNVSIEAQENTAENPALETEKALLQLFPNPATTVSTLKVDFANSVGNDPIEIAVMSMDGSVVFNQTLDKKEAEVITIPVEEWKSGIYFVKLSQGSELSRVVKLVVSK